MPRTEAQRKKNTEAKRAWRARDIERSREINRSYVERNPEKVKASSKKRSDKRTLPENRDAYRSYLRKRHLEKKFGLSLEDYQEMFFQQDGNCAICGVNQSDLSRNLAVDHCHKTGKIRSLLCTKCNMILGSCDDNPTVLKNAIAYLKLNT